MVDYGSFQFLFLCLRVFLVTHLKKCFTALRGNISRGYLVRTQTANQWKNPASNPSQILAKSLYSVLPDLLERSAELKALRQLGGDSQEQDTVGLRLGRDHNSDSLCRKEVLCYDFYWLEEQREGPWQCRGLWDTKGQVLFFSAIFLGEVHKPESSLRAKQLRDKQPGANCPPTPTPHTHWHWS